MKAPLTQLESDVMQAVWDHQPCSVEKVHEFVSRHRVKEATTRTMLRRLDAMQPQPVLRETKRIHDALLWQGRLCWGDRTPAMICARGDILQGYGVYRESVAFCYLQTSSTRPPARLEFPRWMLDDGLLEPVLDVVLAEVVAGQGYPYAIEAADAVSVITMQDRAEFYGMFQEFIERQGLKFTFSTKSMSKGRRR